MTASAPTSAAAPSPLSRDEVSLDYGLKAQSRLALYAAGFFGIGLPLLLWVAHLSLPGWLLGLWLAAFTLGWSAFLALRRQVRRLEPQGEAADRADLRRRLHRHCAASGVWVAIQIGMCLSAALYGARPDMLLLLCAGSAAGVIFFSAPVLIGLLVFGVLAAAAPLLALMLVPHDSQMTQIMSGGLALTFAMAFTLNRHMQEHYLLEHDRLALARERESARAEAQAQGQARIALMETLSREIRTGLRGVEQNLLHSLTHLTRAPAPRQYVDAALGEIGHLQTMLTTTLDNDTAAAGRIELDTAPLDAGLICRRLCAQFAGLAQGKGLGLSCNLDALPARGAALGDEHRVEQAEPSGDIVVVVLPGVLHRFADEGVGGHMDHRLDPVPGERVAQRAAVGDIGLHEGGPLGHRIAMPLAEVVVHDDAMSVADQFLHDHASDVPGAAGDQYIHAAGFSLSE